MNHKNVILKNELACIEQLHDNRSFNIYRRYRDKWTFHKSAYSMEKAEQIYNEIINDND